MQLYTGIKEKMWKRKLSKKKPYNVPIKKSINTPFSLEQLYRAIEQCTGIPPNSQILMTSLGIIVKKENIKQVIEAANGVCKKTKKKLIFEITKLIIISEGGVGFLL